MLGPRVSGKFKGMMGLHWGRWSLRRARRAARAGEWAAAAAAYRRHLAHAPADAAAWVQLGHSLKETGALAEATAAYREAVRIVPGVADGWIHLAHLERGNREMAIATLEQALAADAGSAMAVEAMLALGARERLPHAVQRRIEAEEGHYAPSRYTAWAAVRPSPAAVPVPDVLAVIDARAAAPERVAETRASLSDIACLILTDDPAAGAAPAEDASYVRPSDAIGDTHANILLVEAGTRLAPDAVARLRDAVTETKAGAAYADHDHWTADGGGTALSEPCFQPMFDPFWFARAAVRPPCLLVRATVAAPYGHWGGLLAVRLALPVAYAHVPLVLASRSLDAVPVAPALSLPAHAAGADSIQVIVQTRDAPDMLEACIDTLRATAHRPDLLEILIVDNRSVLPGTAALLADWAARGIARTLPHDAPFNWAQANNLAAARGDAPCLLFLNNDVEMQSEGWDTALCEGLAIAGVGVLGALLLYPDGLIQHAGVVFGGGAGGPLHEGAGQPPMPGGPGDRWRHPRLAAAVTGAWMATTRTLFEAIGGFEERLPIGYNDIDFCLRVRAIGRHVVQASHIVALHRESATRGLAMSAAAHARDMADWAWLRARWGEALDLDPAYNPHWQRVGQPFDGLREPSPQAVSCWIAASARTNPWAVAPPT